MYVKAIIGSIFIILGACILLTESGRSLSVHVLDNTSGGNAANVSVKGYRRNETGEFDLIGTGVTNSGGRVYDLVSLKDYTNGTYRVWLDTKSYFNSKNMTTLWGATAVTFYVREPSRDHHIPIALSPFGFQTYRGI